MSAIKNRVLFGLSMVIALVALGFIVNRLVFLAHARHTTGAVIALHASNGSCSCGRRCHYPCTRFGADVQFPESESAVPLRVTAGTERGFNQPVEDSQYRIGDSVPVIYNPGDTSEAYRDTFGDVWGAPLAALFFHLVTLVGSFAKPRSFPLVHSYA